MRRAHHIALLAAGALAPAWLLVNVPPSATPRIAATPAAVTVSANGEYLIQFASLAAQRSEATQRLDVEEVELTPIAVNLPISLATLTPEEAAAVANTQGVVAVSPNSEFHSTITQPSPPWGLDRSDQTDLPLDQSFTYSDSGGAGTTIYIIDSGINAAHVEFAGRQLPGFVDPLLSGGINDCYGHGTHVAGIAGGTTYGIAKLATLVPVRVLNCAGGALAASVVNGIDWVIGQHTSGRAVANLSLGSDHGNVVVDNAVEALVADGVAVAVAAGNGDNSNNGVNACNSSPARSPSVLTVGATTSQDVRSRFSNFGSCVDLFAPGSNILSAWNDTPTATKTVSGTSMAAPHVAGALAVLWSDNPGMTATQVQQLLMTQATPDRLTNVGASSPNLLLRVSPSFQAFNSPPQADVLADRCTFSPVC